MLSGMHHGKALQDTGEAEWNGVDGIKDEKDECSSSKRDRAVATFD